MTTTLPGVFTPACTSRNQRSGIVTQRFHIEVSTHFIRPHASPLYEILIPRLLWHTAQLFSLVSRKHIWSSCPCLTQSMSNSNYLASPTTKNEFFCGCWKSCIAFYPGRMTCIKMLVRLCTSRVTSPHDSCLLFSFRLLCNLMRLLWKFSCRR